MGVETLISSDEYLSTSYSPDVEYVDGVLEERTGGDWLHSLVQSNIIFALRLKYQHVKAVAELRSQTTASRFRLPDVCVLLSAPTASVLRDPAFLVIEILSEDDRMTKMMEKLQDYAANGVPNIWLIDPRLEQIYIFRAGTLERVAGDAVTTSDPRLELTRQEIFQK